MITSAARSDHRHAKADPIFSDFHSCLECPEVAIWVRSTQFSGDHHYCDDHARVQSDFLIENPSHFVWRRISFFTLKTFELPKTYVRLPMINEPVPADWQVLNEEIGHMLTRIYALDPSSYTDNERHIRDQFTRLAHEAENAADAFRRIGEALRSLGEVVRRAENKDAVHMPWLDTEVDANIPAYVIDEEPSVADLT